jgi:hypothetical protein
MKSINQITGIAFVAVFIAAFISYGIWGFLVNGTFDFADALGYTIFHAIIDAVFVAAMVFIFGRR